ncbi:hypothetical protein OB13_12020 [Pontibacter sp. HJ8]
MSHTAAFRFEGSLNDFLRPARKSTRITYLFSGTPAVKDAIEALGIPHPEVQDVVVNGEPAHLTYRLQDGDEVQVYPWDGKEDELLKGIAERKFVLDVHLGTLARSLRMLGFDTLYDNHVHDKQLVELAQSEQRIVLTRDVDLLKNKAIPVGYWLRSQQTGEQLQEVIRRFHLVDHIKPFTRCMICNGRIAAVEKQTVLHRLPPKTQLYFDEFYRCSSCRRVYWKGSHYERMQELIRKLKQDL